MNGPHESQMSEDALNVNPIISTDLGKMCSRCKTIKNNNSFYKQKNNQLRSWCKKCHNDSIRKYCHENPERIKQITAQSRNKQTSKDKKRLAKIRQRNNPKYRLNEAIRAGVSRSLNETKNGRSWESILGYSADKLRKHLEKQFKNGMTWENYGLYGWHVDHILPISKFNFQDETDEDFKRCWALKNLRPLLAKDNLTKNNKLKKPLQQSLVFKKND